ncbi:MAG: hypothetical protein IJ575_08365 [Selenomonadaceae bacterium]|nr:hypothetical protein [Selenomonadaceae bacterium]
MLDIALLTAAIETPLFFLFGFKKFRYLIFFAGINIVSNLLLNGFLDQIDFEWWILIVSEIFVVILEFSLCTYFIEPSRKLFRTIVATNLASLILGLIIFY